MVALEYSASVFTVSPSEELTPIAGGARQTKPALAKLASNSPRVITVKIFFFILITISQILVDAFQSIDSNNHKNSSNTLLERRETRPQLDCFVPKIMQAKIRGVKARTTIKVRNLQKNVRKKTFMTVVARA
jgi:hypothetical protein